VAKITVTSLEKKHRNRTFPPVKFLIRSGEWLGILRFDSELTHWVGFMEKSLAAYSLRFIFEPVNPLAL
jgi:hypothetical protein